MTRPRRLDTLQGKVGENACLLLGFARRTGYTVGALYTLLIWAVGEGFGGPYTAGSTDVGTGIVYTLLFVALLVFAPPARRERLSIDRVLVPRWSWWRYVAEPDAVDRVRGAPLVEPVVVGQCQPRRALQVTSRPARTTAATGDKTCRRRDEVLKLLPP
jgi:hypothetical protein